MTDESVEDKLLVEEYKSCRDLISKNIDIMEKNEVFSLGACAVVFGFSLAATQEAVAILSAWLPSIIVLLGFLRFYGLDDTIDKINGHLIELEQTYAKLNWTTYYRKHNSAKVLKKTRYGFWIALGIVCVGFGCFQSVEVPHKAPSGSDSSTKLERGKLELPYNISG